MAWTKEKKWLAGSVGAVIVIGGALFFGWSSISSVFSSEDYTVAYKAGKVQFVQADKRAVFIFFDKDNAGFACPEPSPDVRSAVDRAAKALTEVQGKLPKDASGELKTTVEATQKVVTNAMMQRTQGLQVLRDMLFQACLANVRGDMAGYQYVAFVSTILPKLTTSLIATEMFARQENEKTRLSKDELQMFLNFLILNGQ